MFMSLPVLFHDLGRDLVAHVGHLSASQYPGTARPRSLVSDADSEALPSSPIGYLT